MAYYSDWTLHNGKNRYSCLMGFTEIWSLCCALRDQTIGFCRTGCLSKDTFKFLLYTWVLRLAESKNTPVYIHTFQSNLWLQDSNLLFPVTFSNNTVRSWNQHLWQWKSTAIFFLLWCTPGTFCIQYHLPCSLVL